MSDEAFIEWRDALGADGAIVLTGDGGHRVTIEAPPAPPPVTLLPILRGPEGPQGPQGPAFGDDLPDFTLIFDNRLV